MIRTTTYKLAATEFTGTSYTLTLNNDLESDYYVMIAGSESGSGGGGVAGVLSLARWMIWTEMVSGMSYLH